MRLSLQSAVTIFIFFFTTSVLFAQTGKIAGKITDASTGEGLPFVNVIVEGTSTGAASDIDGNYFIINLGPGTYSVKASAIGYNPVVVTDIKVASGFTSTVDFQLKPTSVAPANDRHAPGRPCHHPS